MLDLLYLLIIVGAFALLAALVAACSRLVGDDRPVAVPVEVDRPREEVQA